MAARSSGGLICCWVSAWLVQWVLWWCWCDGGVVLIVDLVMVRVCVAMRIINKFGQWLSDKFEWWPEET